MDQATGAPNISLDAVFRIVIVRVGAIGDTIVLFPLLAALRRRFPKAQISAVGRSEVWEVAQSAGLCDRVFSSESIGWWTFAASPGTGTVPVSRPDSRLLAVIGGADLLINADGGLDSCAADTRANELSISRIITIPALPPDNYTKPAAKFYLEAVHSAAADLHFSGEPAFIRLAGDDNKKTNTLLIAPGAGSPRKRAPARVFVDIANTARSRNLQIALVVGEADAAAEREYYENGGAADRVFRNVKLSDLFREMQRCAGFVANDSGMAHLAAFAGLRGWVFFTVTDANVWAPPSPHVRYSYVNDPAGPGDVIEFIVRDRQI
ncbi:MAG: glycosyltransferase family 9 protein [Planctomycetota bacterium]